MTKHSRREIERAGVHLKTEYTVVHKYQSECVLNYLFKDLNFNSVETSWKKLKKEEEEVE